MSEESEVPDIPPHRFWEWRDSPRDFELRELLEQDDVGRVEVTIRDAIEEATSEIEFDEIRGAIYLVTESSAGVVRHEFKDWKSLRGRLVKIGEGALDETELESEQTASIHSWVEEFLVSHDIKGFFGRLEEPVLGEQLLKADTLLAPGAGLVVQIDVEEINAEVVRYLAAHPEKMRTMNPRSFEVLVAELFRAKGYDVEVTPRSKDGGLDIRVVHKTELGRFLTLIECKRYAPENKVGVEIVRGLYGVVSAENATSGLIATTSYFSKGAKSFQKSVESRMSLADFEELKKLLMGFRGL